MTEPDKISVHDLDAIASADDPDAMDRNARVAAHLWSAYEYAKTSFGGHVDELRDHWRGAAAARFAEEAEIVRADVGEMGTVLQAHTEALPVVADAMRRLKSDAETMVREYEGRRRELEKQPPDKAKPDIRKLDDEYMRKSVQRMRETNDVYHRYNNGYLAPPKEFRGVLPDSAQPQLQTAAGPGVPPPPVAPPTASAAPPQPWGADTSTVVNSHRPTVVAPVRPVGQGPVIRPPVTRGFTGTPGPGAVRTAPSAGPRSTMMTRSPAGLRPVSRLGPGAGVPASVRTAAGAPPAARAAGAARPVAGVPGTVRSTGVPASARPVAGVPGTVRSTGAPGSARPVAGAPPTHPAGSARAASGLPPTVRPAGITPGTAGGAAGVRGNAVLGQSGQPGGTSIPRQTLISPQVAAGRGAPAAPAVNPATEPRWTRSPLVRASSVPSPTPNPPAPPPGRPAPAWGRTPWVDPPEPTSAASDAASRPRPAWGRTPWVRPRHGSAAYPSVIAKLPDEPTAEPESAEADEPLLDPVTLSRLLAESGPAEREKLLAAEAAKLERIQAATKESVPQANDIPAKDDP